MRARIGERSSGRLVTELQLWVNRSLANARSA